MVRVDHDGVYMHLRTQSPIYYPNFYGAERLSGEIP